MEKEITTTNQTTALADSLIVVQQLPIIKEQLHSIKAQAQESVKEALSLACTEETLKVVKERRAALNRDRKDLDARRMAVKKQIMQPFEDFDEVYKECVTDVYGPADEALKGKITDVEAGLKADKEKKVKDYFAEMVKASGVEWVTYENVGVAVTLTAKAVFSDNNFEVKSRLIAEPFLDYSKIAAQKSEGTRIMLDRKELLGVLGRVKLARSADAKEKSTLVMDLEPGGTGRASMRSTIAQMNEEFSFNGKLEEHLRIGFNLEFLSEALKSMEGDEVSAWVVGPLSPVKLIEPQYEALVLPVKVKGEA